ncbi:MAG: hypothetical protein H0W76_12855 [Pyrinomonadaceae bacterium]|nr:hypothetical protein [Pyrinomonadaceae bacterium]
MSNEQPPLREVIPFKSGKRPSTFRKLNIDFAGTAIEEALNERDRQHQQEALILSSATAELLTEPTHHQSPPVTTTPPLLPVENYEDISKLKLPFVSDLPDIEEETPPVTTTPQQVNYTAVSSVAPARDFNRRANSLDRDAMPSGLFPGSTKKVYDALYIRTRGAITPTKTVQASRRDLLTWTGIRNLKTIDNHIRYLMATGLIVRHWELGSNEGSNYEVRLPEESHHHHSPPLTTTGGVSSLLSTTHQNTSSGYTQKLGSGGEGQITENTDTSTDRKTHKNDDDDDNTHTLDEFLKEIAEAACGVVGGKLINTEQERKQWKRLGRLLADELREAAERTNTISSVPAFFTAHLRRRLSRKSALIVETKEAQKSKPRNHQTFASEVNTSIKKEPGNASHHLTPVTGRSKFSLEECRRYAEHLHTTGQGINNPGGYATTIHRTGEADMLIESFLHPEAAHPSSNINISQCPDCQGTGFYYPQGVEAGVARCKHEQLKREGK